MDLVVFVGSAILIVQGTLAIFAKDLYWEIVVFINRTGGLASEKARVWETRSTIGGVVSILFGALGIWVVLTR